MGAAHVRGRVPGGRQRLPQGRQDFPIFRAGRLVPVVVRPPRLRELEPVTRPARCLDRVKPFAEDDEGADDDLRLWIRIVPSSWRLTVAGRALRVRGVPVAVA
jgi:hypothetical protein